MKKYVVLAVVVVVAALLLAGVDFYTDKPSFCSNCHQVRPYYRAWKRSPHAKVECNRCHEPGGLAGALIYKASVLRNVSLQNSYYGRFRPLKADPVANQVCLDCHGAIAEPLLMKSGVRMSHRALVKGRVPCQSCHRGVAHLVIKPEANNLKDSCTSCHNGAIASSDCAICHTKDIAGKQSPDDYDVVALDENQCGGCHTKPVCENCHTRGAQGEIQPPEPED